jgi:hypothetical protein
LGSLNGKDQSEYLHIDRRIILKWTVGKDGGRGQGQVVDSCECGFEPFASIREEAGIS